MPEQMVPAAPTTQGSIGLRGAFLAPDILSVLRKEFGLRQKTIAVACGTTDRTVRSWEQGQAVRQGHADRLLALAEVVNVLSTTLKGGGIDQWLWARLRPLSGKRAVELLGRDRDKQVLAVARAFAGGDYV